MEIYFLKKQDVFFIIPVLVRNDDIQVAKK